MAKFADIPQLTRDGNYAVDIGMDFLADTMERYEREYGLNLDVDFQRAHVWTEGQQIAFVEHLLRGGKGCNQIRFNHPLWMRFTNAEVDDGMVCVDGKQRLTACMAFVQNKIPAFGYFYYEYEDRMRLLNSSLHFIINDLRTRKEVLTWYLEINEGGTPHTEEELSKVRHLLSSEE